MTELNNKKVWIKECKEYSLKTISPLLEQLFSDFSIPSLEGKTVLIKPNLVSPATAQQAVTPHFILFEALILHLQNRMNVGKIIAGDSPGVVSGEKVAKKANIYHIAEKYGVEWVEFKESDTMSVENPLIHPRFQLSSYINKVDYIINLAKMKTHQMLMFTGAMKNLFGFVCGLEKAQFHMRYPNQEDFGKMITDLNQVLPNMFHIVDAVVGMEGAGPMSGEPRFVGRLVGGVNPLAVDIALTSYMGKYDPKELPSIKAGLTLPDSLNSVEEVEYLHLKPENIADYKTITKVADVGFAKNILPAWLYNIIKNALMPRPVINRSCIRCNRCVTICPPTTMTLPENKGRVKINYKNCIRCYCCHEVCPVDAIDIKRKLF